MKTAFIACGLLKADLDGLLEEIKPDFDIYWLEPGLHNSPEKLRIELQKKIDELQGYDKIILSYALCGNALIGIKATHCDVVYLKSDDCINAFMCENPCLSELRRRAIFTNRSWLTSSISDSDEITRMYQKYGEERAKQIIEMMYKHYKELVYMKTEQDEIDDENLNAAKKFAEKINVELIFEPATLRMYRNLISQQPDENIKTLKKGETLTPKDFFE